MVLGKGKKIGIGAGIAVGAFFALVIAVGLSSPPSAPSQNSNEATQKTDSPDTKSNVMPSQLSSPTKVAKIDRMIVLGGPSENVYQARFSLVDAEQSEVAEDGNVFFKVVDNANRTLYESRFAVKKAEFQTYQLVLTGQPLLAYVWNIPVSEVKAGIGTWGKANISFVTTDGKEFTSSYDIMSIPQLSNEEVKQFYENAYLQNAIDIGKTVRNGSFEITLVRVGWFEHLEFSTVGDKVTEFRTDFIIKNIGNEAEYIPSKFAIVDSNGNQHDSTYGGSLGFKEVLPNATIQGYELYDTLSREAGKITIFAKDNQYNPSSLKVEDIYWNFEVDLR